MSMIVVLSVVIAISSLVVEARALGLVESVTSSVVVDDIVVVAIVLVVKVVLLAVAV